MNRSRQQSICCTNQQVGRGGILVEIMWFDVRMSHSRLTCISFYCDKKEFESSVLKSAHSSRIKSWL